jgi:CheY-like chemotaxis protein/HPt (histidine-containing phosphotransfer) domain-containing protein
MQGRIWAESAIGAGSTFYFTAKFGVRGAPAAGPDAAEVRELPNVAPQASSSIAPGLRILVADDSEDNRFLILSYLKGTGSYIDVAENGRIALDKFQNGGYDLVLMDVDMPEMDGYAATGAIRRQEQESAAEPTPILALTAHAFADSEKRSLAAGFTAHLAKPIRRATLLEAIGKHAPCRRAEPLPQNIHVTVNASLQDLIPGYLDKRRKDVPKLIEALDSGDFDTVRRLGHNLKGTGAGYGFSALTDMGAAIEEGAKANNGDAIRGTLDELKLYLDQVAWTTDSSVKEE